jgi:quercetin dioxygenase-like cupin family protein
MSEQASYTIMGRKLIAETPELRVQEMILAPGDCIPWHYHSGITDTFYCLEGELHIASPRPATVHRLRPGDSLAVPPRRAHEVSNHSQHVCRFILVQGVGTYDFVSVEH